MMGVINQHTKALVGAWHSATYHLNMLKTFRPEVQPHILDSLHMGIPSSRWAPT